MAYPLKDYHPIFNSNPLHDRPSVCRQMINTCISYVRWDLRDPHNFKAAAEHRLGVDTQALTRLWDEKNGLAYNPRMQRILAQCADRLAKFLRLRCERHGAHPVPLTYEGAMYVINKLKQTQPRAKIQKLKAVAKLIPWDVMQGAGFRVVQRTQTSLFIKAEGYPGPNKPPRLICFPAEGEKLLMSMAFFHLMHPMFSSAYCTKEIPEHYRPKAIEQRLEGLPVKFVADYTSFECVPNKLMMRLGEHRVYRQLLPREYHFLLDVIERGGTLRAQNGFSIRTPAVQYSGRYTTSLSNTIRNKLLMDSVAEYIGVGVNNYRGVYEGDDSLTAWPAGTTQEQICDALGKLGVAAEMARYDKIGQAGYCSMYWNDNYELICDPLKVIATFPFTTSACASREANIPALAAAKAMSLAYRSPGCPIVSAVVRRYIQGYGLMETRNEYERKWFRQFTKQITTHTHSIRKQATLRVQFNRWDLVREPTNEQRLLFWEIFGIDPIDQKIAERKILEEDGFTESLLLCLEGAQEKCGVDLNKLKGVYWEMRERARHFQH